MKRFSARLGIVLIITAILLFGGGVVRAGAMLFRANVGIYEALILGAIGAVVYLSSRRK